MKNEMWNQIQLCVNMNKEQSKFASTSISELTPAGFYPLSNKLKSFRISLETNLNVQKASKWILYALVSVIHFLKGTFFTSFETDRNLLNCLCVYNNNKQQIVMATIYEHNKIVSNAIVYTWWYIDFNNNSIA